MRETDAERFRTEGEGMPQRACRRAVLRARSAVARVVGARPDAGVEIGADHGAQKFDRAFLHGVGGGAKPSGEIAVEVMLDAESVIAFVEQHSVVGDRLPEVDEERHLHIARRTAY